MTRSGWLVGILLGCALTQPALAVEYLITVQATATSDGGAPTVFGDPNPSFPVSNSFLVDYDNAIFIGAGTVFDSVNGYRFTDDAHLFSLNAGLIEANMPIGNVAFPENSLTSQSLGDSGSFQLIVAGQIGSPTGVHYISTHANLGELIFGSIYCPTSDCTLFPEGTAISNTDGGFAALTNFSVSASSVNSAVPEPTAWAFMIVGFGLIGVTIRRRNMTMNIRSCPEL